MINVAELWEMEQNFWLADTAYFTKTLAEGCVMVFPSTGILTGTAIVDALNGSPRWAHIDMTDRVELANEQGVVTIAYRANARRKDDSTYEALCSSTYVGENGDWILQHHHQSER